MIFSCVKSDKKKREAGGKTQANNSDLAKRLIGISKKQLTNDEE